MRNFILVVAASLIGIGGCRTPVATQVPANMPTADAPVVGPGQNVALTRKSQSPGITVTYEGVVKQTDAASITIENTKRITRRDEPPPARPRLPLVDRERPNSGVAREDLPGAVTLQRSDLSAIELLPSVQQPAAEQPPAELHSADQRPASATNRRSPDSGS